MDRRSFFQSIVAGIGVLVGYKVLPKAKAATGGYLLPDDVPDDLKNAILELPNVKSGESCIEYYNSNYPGRPYTITIPTIDCESDSSISYAITVFVDWDLSTDAKTDKTTD